MSDTIRMRWEAQELNREIPEKKFPEVFFAGLSLLGCVSKLLGSFLPIDQKTLDKVVHKGGLPFTSSEYGLTPASLRSGVGL